MSSSRKDVSLCDPHHCPGQHLSPSIILSVALVELQVLKELVYKVVQAEE